MFTDRILDLAGIRNSNNSLNTKGRSFSDLWTIKEDGAIQGSSLDRVLELAGESLLEMIQVSKANNESDYDIIAYKDKIFTYNNEQREEVAPLIIKHLGLENSEIPYNNTPIENMEQVEYYIQEEGPDVLYGRVSDNTLYLHSYVFKHSKLSSLLKKVVNQLDILEVSYDYITNDGEDSEVIVRRNEIDEEIKNHVFYHGTSSKALYGIAQKGLMPGGSKTNFPGIEHDEDIFITVNKDKAFFHAETAARNNQDIPVILELRVPNPSLLGDDYDVVVNILKSNSEKSDRYENINSKVRRPKTTADESLIKRLTDTGEDINKKLGIFSYSGRIPATYIDSFLIDDEAFSFYHVYEEKPDKIKDLNSWDRYDLKDFNGYLEDIENKYAQEQEDYEEDYEEED